MALVHFTFTIDTDNRLLLKTWPWHFGWRDCIPTVTSFFVDWVLRQNQIMKRCITNVDRNSGANFVVILFLQNASLFLRWFLPGCQFKTWMLFNFESQKLPVSSVWISWLTLIIFLNGFLWDFLRFKSNSKFYTAKKRNKSMITWTYRWQYWDD